MISIKRAFIQRVAGYYYELAIIAGAGCSAFMFFALYSYSPYDTSFLFYHSGHTTILNWCGALGAHMAAALFYFFGGAAYACVPLFGSFLYFLCMQKRIAFEWERIISAFLLVPLIAALAALSNTDFMVSSVPGGFCGVGLAARLHAALGPVGGIVALYTLILMAFVLLTRFSFIWIGAPALCILKKSALHIGRIPWCAKIGTMYALVKAKICAPLSAVKETTSHYFGRQEEQRPDLSQFSSHVSGTRDLVHENPADLLDDFVEYPEIEERSQKTHEFFEQKEEESLDEMISNPEPVQQQSIVTQTTRPVQASAPKTNTLSSPYILPNLDVFVGVEDERHDAVLKQELETRARMLEEKLERFGVKGSIVSIKRGPVVTLFEYKPEIDTKLSKILALEDDLALALQAHGIRILAPIPGKPYVGFEVANQHRKDVFLGRVIKSEAYRNFTGSLPLVLGEDTVGTDVIVDLVRMPHLLIAGSTGAGKSVALNSMLMSLLCACKPDHLKLILIDPKRLEFASYADIGHLLFPIVTDPKQAAPVLRWVVSEMETRYEKMAELGVRNIRDFNQQGSPDDQMPFIVVIIDELADLMMTAGRDIEELITRITQMARAAGIHMIVATQRPSVDVITGLIKVNFPSRISFRVTSKVDSRTILDCNGADKLLGRGDMLFLDATNSSLKRIHGAYVSDLEIERIVKHIRSERPAEYLDLSTELATNVTESLGADDVLYQQVVEFIQDVDEISISLLQRRFRIGYNRSARIIDYLEAQGFILPSNGSKMRKVIR